MIERTDFDKAVTVYIDTRETKYAHITDALDLLGAKWERRKLDIGDSSFAVGDKDFSLSYIYERKASVDELYSNLMERSGNQTNRLEKELRCAARFVRATTLIVEGVPDMDAIANYIVPDWAMKAVPNRIRRDIGKPVHAFLTDWHNKHRTSFQVLCVADKADTARVMLDGFWRFYQSYRESIAPRKARQKK